MPMTGALVYIGQSHFARAFRQLGFRVFRAHHDPGSDLVLTRPVRVNTVLDAAGRDGVKPDFLFYCDDGNLPLLIDPQNWPGPSLYYSIDTYCNPWHIPYAGGFDVQLVAQKDFVPLFKECDAQWLPLFTSVIEPDNDFASRDIPVAFVGTRGHKNNPGREPFLLGFKKRQPLFITQGDYTPVFDRSRIVLNQTAFGELNFRCFEGPACGAALLMEDCQNGLRDIFTPGHDILPLFPRHDSAAAAKIAAEYLARPQELAAIAARGKDLVRKKHTVEARAATVAEYALEASATHFSPSRQWRADSVRKAFAMLGVELVDPRWEQLRKFFLKLATES